MTLPGTMSDSENTSQETMEENSSPSGPSYLFYLLKVTKILVKMSQFEFLVMTEKYIFIYNFFVIKYFRFWFIFNIKIATQRPEKNHPTLSQQPPLKIEVLSIPFRFFKQIW